MAEPLKNSYGVAVINRISQMIQKAYPAFNATQFKSLCRKGYTDRGLMDRGRLIAEALGKTLPSDFKKSAKIIERALGPKLKKPYGNGMATFTYLPFTNYVAQFGLEYFEESMQLLYELTQRFTAEFSIRPFLEKYPERTIARLLDWTKDSSVFVRRLTSEGSRTRLPWGKTVPHLKKNPQPIIKILEQLKDDPEPYVQRSVANSLNDLSKDHSKLFYKTIKRWNKSLSTSRKKIISHAMRSAIKRMEPEALLICGCAKEPQIKFRLSKRLPHNLQIGKTITLEIEVKGTSDKKQKLLIDLQVSYPAKKGRRPCKVFKLKQLELQPRGICVVKKSISFAQQTTRKQRPGQHELELLVNGRTFKLGRLLLSL